MSSTTQMPPQTTLFLLAHNDDEFFVRPLLIEEVARGHRIMCVYTTDGAAYGENPERRHAESVEALRTIGIDQACIVPIGMRLGVRDGASHRAILPLWHALVEATSGAAITRIVTLAWDGGHADHDAAHLLGVALGQVMNCHVDEFPVYHRFRTIGPLFWCMSLLPGPGDITHHPVSLFDAIRWLAASRHYKTQRRTFAALLGFCVPQILFRRRLLIRRVPRERDYLTKPHGGELLYERRFKVPHREFTTVTANFINEYVMETVPSRERQSLPY
jgi:LmbE family N-acetylglucosaminyl deacetylase